MAVKDLGTKLTCQNCEAKFYDFDKKKPVCPKCGTEYVAVKVRTRRSTPKPEKLDERVNSEEVKPKSIVDTTTAEEKNELPEDGLENLDIPEVDDDEEDNSTLIEDTSDMGDDDNDIAGVIVNNDSSGEIV